MNQIEPELSSISQQELVTIIDELAVPFFRTGDCGRLVVFSCAFNDMLGYKSIEIHGAKIEDLCWQKEEWTGFLRQLKEGHGRLHDHEMQLRHQDGSLVWISSTARHLHDEHGKITGIEGVVRDITALKRSKEELEKYRPLELEETTRRLKDVEIRLRSMYENSLTAIYTFDNTKAFIDSNPAGEKLLGYSRAELLRMRIPDVDANAEAVVPAHKELLGGNTLENFEHQLCRKDGTIITVLNNSVPLKNNQGEVIGLQSFLFDITKAKQALQEREAMIEKLQKAQKMEALGLMAGGVAHDLNNILAGIVSFPEILLMDMDDDNPIRSTIEDIGSAGERAVAVVGDLLTMARGAASVRETTNLNKIIGEFLLSPEFQTIKTDHALLKVSTDLDIELFNISCSPAHIKKCLLNLVLNGAEASDGQGYIVISSRNQYIDQPLMGNQYLEPAEYVVLTVRDNGSGISPEHLDRIFDPFYTKKIMGRSGTGLGLTIVWNTMRDHGGTITAESNEQGTVFDLYFPICREDLSTGHDDNPEEDLQGQGESILVIDDEAQQREIARRMLNKLGYTANTVSSGEEAIVYLQQNRADLLILDMIMPLGLDGCQTYEQIIKENPQQRAIICSGFSESSDVKKAQSIGAGPYLRKPYNLRQLGLAILQELHKEED